MSTEPALEALATQTVHRHPIEPDALGEVLGVLGARWSVEGELLTLKLAASMTETGRIAAFAGELADELDHHPTITLAYAGLTLSINTHDVAAITGIDALFAARLERWLRRPQS